MIEHFGEMQTAGTSGESLVDEVVKAIEDAGLTNDKGLMKRIALVESRFGTHPNTYRSGYSGGIWQVDKIGFEDTQNTASHPGLTAKHKLIKDKLGIDWKTVKWADLTKPLYSALAARLLLLNIPAAIPADLTDQAKYWKKYYNSAAGAGTWEKFKEDVEAHEKK